MYKTPLDDPIIELDIQTIDQKEKVRDIKVVLAKPFEYEEVYFCHYGLKGVCLTPGNAFGSNPLESLCRGISGLKFALREYVEKHKMILIFENKRIELDQFEKMFEI